MHGELTPHIQNGLGVYYLLVLLLNLGFAAYLFWLGKNKPQALLWTVVGVVVHGRPVRSVRDRPTRGYGCVRVRSGGKWGAVGHIGPLIPPSLRTRQKWTAMSNATTNGIATQCKT